jgi:hypothetical protein
MGKTEQTTVQEHDTKFTPLQTERTQTRVELLLRKIGLAALTMLGIGYILVNVSIAVLISNTISSIPINSQANINAIAGRVLFLMGSIIAATLGVLFIFGAVHFYEQSQTKGTVFLGVLLGSFYLLCLGVGSTFLLPQINIAALIQIIAPILIAVSAAANTTPNTRFKVFGSLLSIAGGVALAYAIFNFRSLDLIFDWGLQFSGPFMALTVLESAAIILGSVAACVNSLFGEYFDARPFSHMSILLVALVYGIGIFIGSLVLSMSLWDLMWKSPWIGPLNSISEWVMSTVVFWSASLILIDIAGMLLIVGACLGFIYVSQEFSQF